MSVYYNEIDPYAAQWLRNLVAAGHIAPGDVDERSIIDVRPDDVRGYAQCHWFAGIGGWSFALRLAGWDDDRPVWTGSCPCQPFSAAGKRGGGKDERHLWPHWRHLISECKPAILFGEQVEAAAGWGWLDAVLGDLEAEDYATGAAVLGAHSVGAPHIRQRLWFVADAVRGQADDPSRQGVGTQAAADGEDGDLPRERLRAGEQGPTGLLADRDGEGRGIVRSGELLDGQRAPFGNDADRCGAAGLLADADGRDTSTEGLQRGREQRQQQEDGGAGELGDAARGNDGGRQLLAEGSELRQWPIGGTSPWHDCVWLPCTDGRARPTQPGIFPLVNGVSARMGKLRAAGNAIVPQVAAEFIRAAIGGD